MFARASEGVHWKSDDFFCLQRFPAFILATHFPVNISLMFIEQAEHKSKGTN
jgi:hypothetical protein